MKNDTVKPNLLEGGKKFIELKTSEDIRTEFVDDSITSVVLNWCESRKIRFVINGGEQLCRVKCEIERKN